MGTISPYVGAANTAATTYGVPPSILSTIIQKESNWNPNAVNYNSNGTTDVGITQLNSRYYPTASSMSPVQQIDLTAQILSENFAKTGNWFDAVKAYNGSGAAATNYATDVLSKANLGDALASGSASVADWAKSLTEIGAGFLTGNPIAVVKGFNDTTNAANGSSGGGILDGLFTWLKNLFSANTAARLVAVVVGIVLIIVALVYLTGSDKVVTQTVNDLGKAVVTAA